MRVECVKREREKQNHDCEKEVLPTTAGSGIQITISRRDTGRVKLLRCLVNSAAAAPHFVFC